MTRTEFVEKWVDESAIDNDMRYPEYGRKALDADLDALLAAVVAAQTTCYCKHWPEMSECECCCSRKAALAQARQG